MRHKIPADAISMPSDKPYLSVWLNETRLSLYLHKVDYLVTLDNKVLPDLVDALIELQNKPTRNLFDELKEGFDALEKRPNS